MLSKPLVLSMMAIAALSGCLEAVDGAGVETPGTPVIRNVLPATRTIGPESIRLVGDDLTLDGIGIEKPFTNDLLNRANAAIASASVFSSQSGSFLTVIAEENSRASAGTYALVSAGNTAQRSAATFGRFGTSTLPTSGTASYSGQYAGIAFENYGNASQASYLLTTGNISLVTSFTSNNVTGKITNRQAFSTDGSRDTA